MADLTLFYMPGACSRVTMTALEETGVEFAAEPINLMKGEHRRPDYLAINPKGQVPALRIDDRILTENPAILLYLDEQYPAAGLLPTSEDPVRRAQQRADLVWCASSLHPLVRMLVRAESMAPGDPAGARAAATQQLTAVVNGVEARLAANGPWWNGADWSITDIYIFWVIDTARQIAQFDLEPFPAVRAHADAVRARPSFQRTLAREQAGAGG